MSTLPTQPITSALITVQGDPSVGIPHSSYTMELYWDVADWSDGAEAELSLTALRIAIEQLYHEHIVGETPTVLFDYEIAALQKSEDEAAVEAENDGYAQMRSDQQNEIADQVDLWHRARMGEEEGQL